MNDDIRPFSEEELLAFAQGTAPSDLAERIEAAREDDPSLAAELALMAGLKPALAAMGDGANPPGELGWRRLETAIRQDASSPKAAPQTDRRMALWRAAAVVFGLAALGQGAYLAVAPQSAGPGFQTASDGVFDHVLAIRFLPDATEAEIRVLLQDANARLVDGPGALGLYRIAFETEAALTEARADLGAADIVEAVLEE